MNIRKEENQDKTKIGMGNYVTVKVGDTNERITEGKSRKMSKEMAGWYYLAYIDSILVLSHFWWLFPVFSMV